MMLVVMIVVLINTALLAVLFLRDKERAWGSLGNQISGIEKNQERLERLLREEISKGRAEAGANFQKAREEQSEADRRTAFPSRFDRGTGRGHVRTGG